MYQNIYIICSNFHIYFIYIYKICRRPEKAVEQPVLTARFITNPQ